MKKLRIFTILLVIALITAACDDGTSVSVPPEEHQEINDNTPQDVSLLRYFENYIFATDIIERHPDAERTFGAAAHDGRIYCVYMDYAGQFFVISMNADGTDERQITSPISGISTIIEFYITSEGYSAMIAKQHRWTDYGLDFDLIYLKYDDSGDLVSRHEFENIVPQGSQWFEISAGAVSGGNVAIIVNCLDSGANVHLLNKQNDTRTTLGLNVLFNERNILTLQDGRVVVFDNDSGDMVLREIDFDEQNWGEAHLLPDNSHTLLRMFCAGENSQFDILMSDQNYLYAFTFTAGLISLISWVESGIIAVVNEQVGAFSDGRFFMLSGNWWESEITVFTPIQRAQLDERIVITLGGTYLSSTIRQAVVDFNRQSRTHIIRLYDYSGGNWDSVEAGLTRLQIEMMTGQGPDILYATLCGDLSTISARGLLLDIYPFIDADSDINREDFFANVLSSKENAYGALSSIGNRFTVETLIGTQDMLGQVDLWTPAVMHELVEQNLKIDNIFPPWVFVDGFISTMIMFAGDELVDWSTYTAYFDSEMFIQTLETAKLLPFHVGESMGIWTAGELYLGNLLFDIAWLSSIERFQGIIDVLGDNIAVPGFPTADGNGAHILSSRTNLGINAASEHSEVAWQFIREFLLPSAEIYYGFPLRIDLYDAMITEAMAISDEKDEESDESQYGQYFGAETEPYSLLSDNAAELLREIVESARARGRFTPEIMDFIMSDFAAFYAGGRSAEDTARIIQSRVQIWLSEQELVFG